MKKLSIGEMAPERLKDVDDQELLSLNRRLHQLFAVNFAGSKRMTAGDLNREDLVNAALFVWAEMKRRELTVSEETALWRAAHTLHKSDDPDVGEVEPDEWTREDVLEYGSDGGGESDGDVEGTATPSEGDQGQGGEAPPA